MFSVSIAVFLAVTCLEVSGLKVIPERGNVTYVNPKFLEWAYFRVNRLSRKADYYIHAGCKTIHTWGNNITVDIKFLEYLHNEFKPSFVGGRMQLCDFINTEPWIGRILKNAGITCPAPPREYRLDNITVPSRDFPNVFPFAKGRVDIMGVQTDTLEVVGKAYLVATFDQKTSKKNKESKKH